MNGLPGQDDQCSHPQRDVFSFRHSQGCANHTHQRRYLEKKKKKRDKDSIRALEGGEEKCSVTNKKALHADEEEFTGAE